MSLEIGLGAQSLRAMAHRERLCLLGALALQASPPARGTGTGPGDATAARTAAATVPTLAVQCALKPSAVARHLRMLEEAGLVRADASGAYTLLEESLHRLQKELGPAEPPASVGEEAGEEWEQKLLQRLLSGERIKEVPVAQPKRMVLLRWLSRRFEPDRRYPEAEVNEIIRAHHPDWAWMRRELVDAQLLKRERAIYWRAE